MREDYEQLTMDTRRDLDVAIEKVATDAIQDIIDLQKRYTEEATDQTSRGPFRNRHEVYGIAAQNFAAVGGTIKSIKGDMETLLRTLGDPNYPALEAVGSVCNSSAKAAAQVLVMAAEMRQALNDLYLAENNREPTPMETLAAGGDADGFEEADPAEAGEITDDE